MSDKDDGPKDNPKGTDKDHPTPEPSPSGEKGVTGGAGPSGKKD
jgi:hypothetical protein